MSESIDRNSNKRIFSCEGHGEVSRDRPEQGHVHANENLKKNTNKK